MSDIIDPSVMLLLCNVFILFCDVEINVSGLVLSYTDLRAFLPLLHLSSGYCLDEKTHLEFLTTSNHGVDHHDGSLSTLNFKAKITKWGGGEKAEKLGQWPLFFFFVVVVVVDFVLFCVFFFGGGVFVTERNIYSPRCD